MSAGMSPVVVWGPGERVLAEGIAAAAGRGVALAPATSIPELAVLLSGCAAVVGGDTGPVHLAASLGVPTVAVFVATDPARNGPRGERVRVLAAAGAAAGRGRARADGAGEVGVETVFAGVDRVSRCRGIAAPLGAGAARRGCDRAAPLRWSASRWGARICQRTESLRKGVAWPLSSANCFSKPS